MMSLRKMQAFNLFGVLMFIEVLRLFGECEALLSGSCNIAKQWSVYSVIDGTFSHCLNCSECPSGLEVTPPCGSNISATTFTTGCRPCVKGKSFSASEDIGPCKPCDICGENKEVLKECEKDQDTECGGCIKGFYPTKAGPDCLPCQSCCNSSQKHEKCIRDGDKHCMAESKCDLTIVTEFPTNSSNFTMGNNTSPHDPEHEDPKPFLSTGQLTLAFGIIGIVLLVVAVVMAYKKFQNLCRKKRQQCCNIIWQLHPDNSVTLSTSCTTLAKQETRVDLPDTSHEEKDSSLSMSGRLLSSETEGEASGASFPEKELMLRGQDSQFIPVEESRKRY